MPVFATSCHKLPKKIDTNLSSAMSAFWWSSNESHRKTHWIAWDKLCLPENLGGAGFKDLESFNRALVVKQALKVLTSPNSLLFLFFKSRYFPEVNFLEAKLSVRPSYAWRSLLWRRDFQVKSLKTWKMVTRLTYDWIDR